MAWLPEPQLPTSGMRRRVSTSSGDFALDVEGNVLAQLPDSASPLHERISARGAEEDEVEPVEEEG
jgi:hypothetical protein